MPRARRDRQELPTPVRCGDTDPAGWSGISALIRPKSTHTTPASALSRDKRAAQGRSEAALQQVASTGETTILIQLLTTERQIGAARVLIFFGNNLRDDRRYLRLRHSDAES